VRGAEHPNLSQGARSAVRRVCADNPGPVVQTAAKLVLEPIFEADLEENAYGYRPRRNATNAIKEVHRLICRGYTDVVDAHLAKFFDTIPHGDLMQSVARRTVDRDVLHLIKMWLTASVEEQGTNGKTANERPSAKFR
jgi:RNA-directed DNA polymerase